MAIPLKYNLRNLVVRRVSTLMTVGTIALVVAVFVALFALANGLNSSLIATGSPENVLVIRQGSQTEMQSGMTKEAFQIIQTLPGIARNEDGKPKASAEIAVVVNLPRRETGQSSNVTLRGLSEMGFALRPQIKLVEGRMFRPDVGEAIVSRKIVDRFAGTGLGQSLQLGRRTLTVVGIFDAGGSSFDSEIWSGVTDVADALPCRDSLSHGQAGARSHAQMAVQREEGLPFVGSVAEEDDRPVILRHCVVGEGVDGAVERRQDGRSGGAEEVQPEVDGAAFVEGFLAGSESSSGCVRSERCERWASRS